MNCYAGFAKRIVNSCFPRVIPVPQLQPLDARKIFYAASDEEVWKSTLVWAEASSDEEVWKATLVWAEAKAQEREATALKAASETDTDESYDSDDSEVGVSIQPISRLTSLFADDSDDEVFVGPVRRTNIATWESGVRTGLSCAPWVEAERLERGGNWLRRRRGVSVMLLLRQCGGMMLKQLQRNLLHSQKQWRSWRLWRRRRLLCIHA